MLQTKTTDYMLRITYVFTLLLVLLAGETYAQCFDNNIRMGRQKMARGDYRGAKLDFMRSLKCPDAQSPIAHRYIQTCDGKLRQLEQQRLSELKERKAKKGKEQSVRRPQISVAIHPIKLRAIPAPTLETIALPLNGISAEPPKAPTEPAPAAGVTDKGQEPQRAKSEGLPLYIGIGGHG